MTPNVGRRDEAWEASARREVVAREGGVGRTRAARRREGRRDENCDGNKGATRSGDAPAPGEARDARESGGYAR
jgi:hypothetical protein